MRILDVGCGPGWLAKALTEAGHTVVGVDIAERTDGVGAADEPLRRRPTSARASPTMSAATSTSCSRPTSSNTSPTPPGCSPTWPHACTRRARIIASVPNISHWYPRFRIAAGRFDYDQRGVLDATHLRFFTRRRFLRVAEEAGLEHVGHRHTGLPLDALGFGDSKLVAGTVGRVDRLLVRWWPTMFAYQFVYEFSVRSLEPLADLPPSTWNATTTHVAPVIEHRSELRRPAQIVTVVGATLFTLMLCEWKPWRLFARAGFSGNFYDVQAQAFLRGRLAVPADVAGIEGFLVDGKTYLYYGPVLAVARLPLALFGSWTEGRITRLSMIVGFVVLCTFVAALRRAPWRPALLVGAVVLAGPRTGR